MIILVKALLARIQHRQFRFYRTAGMLDDDLKQEKREINYPPEFTIMYCHISTYFQKRKHVLQKRNENDSRCKELADYRNDNSHRSYIPYVLSIPATTLVKVMRLSKKIQHLNSCDFEKLFPGVITCADKPEEMALPLFYLFVCDRKTIGFSFIV